MGAGSQREMILGVLPVPTWLMPSLLFALAMYGALEAYIALNPHPHELARKVKRQLIRSVRWVYGVLSGKCSEGQDGVHTLCINAQRQTANSKVLHITPGGWPDAPVPPQCPQASPGGPIGSP